MVEIDNRLCKLYSIFLFRLQYDVIIMQAYHFMYTQGHGNHQDFAFFWRETQISNTLSMVVMPINMHVQISTKYYIDSPQINNGCG